MYPMSNTERNMPNTNTPREYDLVDLPRLGWITITVHGQENTYFTLADGSVGFVKA